MWKSLWIYKGSSLVWIAWCLTLAWSPFHRLQQAHQAGWDVTRLRVTHSQHGEVTSSTQTALDARKASYPRCLKSSWVRRIARGTASGNRHRHYRPTATTPYMRYHTDHMMVQMHPLLTMIMGTATTRTEITTETTATTQHITRSLGTTIVVWVQARHIMLRLDQSNQKRASQRRKGCGEQKLFYCLQNHQVSMGPQHQEHLHSMVYRHLPLYYQKTTWITHTSLRLRPHRRQP